MKKFYLLVSFIYCTHHVYAQSGKLDPNFVHGITDGVEGSASVNSMVIQSNGKIVVAGCYNPYFFDYGENEGFFLERCDKSGWPDYTFGNNGEVKTFFSSPKVSSPVSLALQKDDKIVAAASADNEILMARYNKNGTLDKSFNQTGKVVVKYPKNITLLITGIALQPDGKIVLGGSYSDNSGTSYDFFVARYNSNGKKDTTFGNYGYNRLSHTGDERATSLALQKDGKIILAGYADDGKDVDFAAARFKTDGSLDLSFGYLVTIGLGGKDYGQSVTIQPNGKIVVAGYSEKNYDDDIALVRYNTNGTLDNTFAGNGKLVKGFGSYEIINAVAIQTNGKIVVGGSYGYNRFIVARFTADGKADTTFSKNGAVTTMEYEDYKYEGKALSIQPEGKIVLAGDLIDDGIYPSLYLPALERYFGDSYNISAGIANEIQKAKGVDTTSLAQNFPNPFISTTTIPYMLPQKFSSAKIIITDKSGRQLKQLNLSSAGNGTIHMDASTLSSGAYNYSLYVDGRLIATKQMILAK